MRWFAIFIQAMTCPAATRFIVVSFSAQHAMSLWMDPESKSLWVSYIKIGMLEIPWGGSGLWTVRNRELRSEQRGNQYTYKPWWDIPQGRVFTTTKQHSGWGRRRGEMWDTNEVRWLRGSMDSMAAGQQRDVAAQALTAGGVSLIMANDIDEWAGGARNPTTKVFTPQTVSSYRLQTGKSSLDSLYILSYWSHPDLPPKGLSLIKNR